MRPRPAPAALLALALGLGGCFVVDELDRADQNAGRFSGASKSAPSEAPAPAPLRRERSLLQRLGDRVADLRDFVGEALERRGPEDEIVPCRLGDGLRYTRRGDCEALGGRAPRS